MLLGDPFERVLDLLVLDGHLQPFELDLRQFRRLELGQQLDRHRVFEIGALLVGRDLDARLQGRPDALFGDRLVGTVRDRFLENLAHDRGPEALLQHRGRHVPRPEARDPHVAAQLLEAHAHLLVDILGGNDDLVLAFQAAGIGLGYLHRLPAFLPLRSAGRRRGLAQPAAELVRAEGFEPPRLASQVPKTCVSTSSTTPARHPAKTAVI